MGGTAGPVLSPGCRWDTEADSAASLDRRNGVEKMPRGQSGPKPHGQATLLLRMLGTEDPPPTSGSKEAGVGWRGELVCSLGWEGASQCRHMSSC